MTGKLHVLAAEQVFGSLDTLLAPIRCLEPQRHGQVTSHTQACQARLHAGYIIGRGVRVVEWNVAEHPDGPDGDLASMKLRALTPDGIRMAIAKEYGLSNYREVVIQTRSTFFLCISCTAGSRHCLATV